MCIILFAKVCNTLASPGTISCIEMLSASHVAFLHLPLLV